MYDPRGQSSYALAHTCWDLWGRAADRLSQALADEAGLSAGSAPTLGSDAAYRALCAARADLCAALDVSCPPAPPWGGGGGEPDDLRSAALALCGGLASDRADPRGQHDPVRRGWLSTEIGDAETVVRARRLLSMLERVFSAP